MPQTEGYAWDGYLHWARAFEETDPELLPLVENADGTRALYEPIFIRVDLFASSSTLAASEVAAHDRARSILDRLNEIGFATLDAAERDSILLEISELAFLKGFVFDPAELLIGLEHAVMPAGIMQLFVYRPVARTPEMHKTAPEIMVIDVGAPARVDPAGAGFIAAVPAGARSPNVVGALIDNDVGFLNRRFRRADDKTRFAAIWLQAREKIVHSAFGFVSHVHLGKKLNGDQINGLSTAFGRDERAAYSALNGELHDRAEFQCAPLNEGHGSMVADLAFGADPDSDDAMLEVPLIAVQLPPEAARDTSGTLSESYIVQGVRWICFWARATFPKTPVVINISYGVLAGQKDGGKFLEQQIDKEIEFAATMDQPVQVVFAFGNSHNSRQVARLTVAPDKPKTLGWLIPPDNPAPCFVEVRKGSDGGLGALPPEVLLTLHPPDGAPALSSGATTRPGEAWPALFEDNTVVEARIYSTPDRIFDQNRKPNPAHKMLAVAPTRPSGHGLAVAQAGAWTIEIRVSSGTLPIDLVLQIQRGDSAPGFRPGGRQSRFEGTLLPDVVDGYAALAVERPLTDEGNNSAFVNGVRTKAAGAGRSLFGAMVRANYSSLGAGWTGKEKPDDLLAIDNAFTSGRAVSGTYSGSGARLSGTSGAAALMTRDIVQGFLPAETGVATAPGISSRARRKISRK